MLQQIFIQNYAIIDELRVDFSPQFNGVTGETGAGKSIVMGALGLVLGQRADGHSLRNHNKKCVVEASFAASKITKEIKQFFLAEDLDSGNDEIIIRREILATGKSRAFINDTPVNLSQMRGLASLQVDLHQQFDTLELGEDHFQRQVLDALAGHGNLMTDYQEIYKKYTAENKKLEALKNAWAASNKELDYHQFLFDELHEANLKENELEALEKELELLSNSENIKAVLGSAVYLLKENEQPMVGQLKNILQQIIALKTGLPEIHLITQRLQSTHIELADIADDLERLNESLGLDPKRLEAANERLNIGNKLLKKHGVKTTAELLLFQQDLEGKLQGINNMEGEIKETEKAVKALLDKAFSLAEKLTANRKKAIKPFEEKTEALLKQVGMPNAKLQVQIAPNTALQNHGADDIQFLFDANKTGRFEPLSKVASGGELSRLMLSIKSIVAGSMQLPTLIFDEIDSGISGEAAKQVGIIMKQLATRHQVIAITHQPQVAAKADAHFFVYKKEKNGSIQTQVKLLNTEERIHAIATMLGGENPSETVLQNAKEMVGD